MLEVMRVFAGFESPGNGTKVATRRTVAEDTPDRFLTGPFQVSANSLPSAKT